MALASSGTMSIGGTTTDRSINLELGRSATATSSLGETDLRTLAGVASGAISMDDFYGASASQAFTTVKSGHTFHTYTGGRGSTQYGFAIGFNCPAAATGGGTPPSGAISYTGTIAVSGTTLGTIQKVAHRHTLIGKTSIEFEIQGTNSNSGFTNINFNNSNTNGISYTKSRTSFGYSYVNGKRTYVLSGLTGSDASWLNSGSSTTSLILGPTTGNSNGTGTESTFSTTVTFS